MVLGYCRADPIIGYTRESMPGLGAPQEAECNRRVRG